jgi:glycosyltransferase involved in cell wall biosynthesis
MASGSRDQKNAARSPVRTSVVLCTRNRAASLARMLDSLRRCDPPRRPWELLVVDNGSSDATPETLERFRAGFPMRVVLEPRAGLSHARNTGVAHASGEYLLWSDDDCTLPREWLQGYEAAFEADPGAAFFGGPVQPRFEGRAPRWLEDNLPLVFSAFAGRDLPQQRGRFDAASRDLPFGANYALRADVARRFPFDPRLGPSPARVFTPGEESDVLRRIADAGFHGVWLPKLAVSHWIDAPRQTVAYLRRYYEGVSFVGTRGVLERGERATGWTARLRLRRRLAARDAAYLGGRLLGRHAVWVAALRDGSRLRGRLRAHRHVAGAGPRLSGSPGDDA